MPDRIGNILSILEAVEEKGSNFLEQLAETGAFEIFPGKVQVQKADGNSPSLLLKPNGLPVWFDITLAASASSDVEVGLSIDFFEYEQGYAELRQRQLTSALANTALDVTDALEALVLASLVKDWAVVESLVFRLGKQFTNISEVLEQFLGRGTARVRSAVARVLATNASDRSMTLLLNFLDEETAEGVRSDVIISYILGVAEPKAVPKALLEKWLGSPELVDALSCITALSNLGKPMPTGLVSLLNQAHHPLLANALKA